MKSADTVRIKFTLSGNDFNLLAIYSLHHFTINLFLNELQAYLIETEI